MGMSLVRRSSTALLLFTLLSAQLLIGLVFAQATVAKECAVWETSENRITGTIETRCKRYSLDIPTPNSKPLPKPWDNKRFVGINESPIEAIIFLPEHIGGFLSSSGVSCPRYGCESHRHGTPGIVIVGIITVLGWACLKVVMSTANIRHEGNSDNGLLVPHGVSISPLDQLGALRLSWNAAPAIPSGTSFTIEYSKDKISWQKVASGVTETSADIAGLMAGEKHYFRVRSDYRDQSSPWSGIVAGSVSR
jgi:hypothetical protein